VIEGGVSANVVADACTIRVDRRTLPGEDPQAVIAEVQALVARQQASDPERTYRADNFLVSNWFQADMNSPFLQRFIQVCADVTGTPAEPVGYLPGSDAKHLVSVARDGMVVFGPGTYEVAHATDEYVEVAELAATHAILVQFVEEILLRG